MKDAAGNEIDKAMEYSIQMRAFLMADKLGRAVWRMARVMIGKKTKEEMTAAMNDATELILEVKKELVGR